MALCRGSSEGPKKWPTSHFIELARAQVPIHHYAPVEGVRAARRDEVVILPNNMEDITPTQVMEKLQSLGWGLTYPISPISSEGSFSLVWE